MIISTRPSAEAKRARLRSVLHGDRCIMAASTYDPLSARVAEDLDFEVGVLGGSAAALAVLGVPDITLITLTELAEQVRRICRASDIPLLVDADHGYGNSLNVIRTVQELADMGACGVSIEDTLLPRRFGSPEGGELISVDEGIGKLSAAVATAAGSGIAVFGRTNALSTSSLDDAVQRLKAYEKSGVDAAFVPYVKTRAQLDAIAAEITLPIILGGPAKELVDTNYLASRRVRVCLMGHPTLGATAEALYSVGKEMAAGRESGATVAMASKATMNRLIRADEYEQQNQQFLNPGQHLERTNHEN